MDMRKSFWVSITLGLSAYFLLPLPGQGASLSERIEEKRDQIAQKSHQEGVLSTKIASYNTRIESLKGQIAGTEERLDAVQDDLDAARRELLRVRDRLEVARDRLERLRAKLSIARDALADRLVELYKADQPDVLTVVLEADGFADLLERTEFLERISEQDRQIVDRVRTLRDEAERQADQLERLEARAQEVAETILSRRNDLAEARSQLVSATGDLRAVRNNRATALSEVRASKAKLEGDLRALEAANAAAQNALQGAGERAFSPGAGGPVRQGSGALIWPVNGPVVSGFGMRWGRLHAGVDIAVPSGTPIRAADSGRVVLAAYTSGYGNYTCVQHNSSLSTCYAHQSSYATSNGAAVSQGQVIGYVGCTGHCFGDHLHFETRINGAPVDPMGYL
jgi:murein DD-endopeptidase MepM/ murein hydrolase activator NlpD